MGIVQKINIFSNIFFLILAGAGLIFIATAPTIPFINEMHQPLIKSWLIILAAVCMLCKLHWHHLFYATVSVVMISINNFTSLLICWEIIAVFGSMIVWKQLPHKTTYYLIMHTLSGALIISGLAMHYCTNTHFLHQNQYLFSFDIAEMCFIAGILVNCAIFPFSSWLLKTYPELKIANLLILSSFTTKAAMMILLKMVDTNVALMHFIKPGDAILFFYTISAYLILRTFFENSVMRQLCYLMIFGLFSAVFDGLCGVNDYREAVYGLSKSVLYQSLLFLCAYYKGLGADEHSYKNKYLINISFLIGVFAASKLPAWPQHNIVLHMVNMIILLRICWAFFQYKSIGCESMRWNEKVTFVLLASTAIILIIYPSLTKFIADQSIEGYYTYILSVKIINNIIKYIIITMILHLLVKLINYIILKNQYIFGKYCFNLNLRKNKFFLFCTKIQDILHNKKILIAFKKNILSILRSKKEKTILFLVFLTIILINYLLWMEKIDLNNFNFLLLR